MDWAELRGKLPLGKGQLPGAMPSFTGLRSGDLVYVDKTSYVQIIAERCEPQVLARPPRFGKSMLVSTLEELFLHGTKPYDGHASYFEGLAIEHSWHDEGQYLVLRLNLANNSKNGLKSTFCPQDTPVEREALPQTLSRTQF